MALVQSKGNVTFLRVHEAGTKYGPPSDQIDVEVVIKLSSQPDRAMGFQLRDNTNKLTHQGMLDLLRDAYNHNWKVAIDYNLPDGKKNGVAIRVALTK